MDEATFDTLLSPDGQAAIAAAAALAPTEAGFLAAFEKLRKRWPREVARAALETVLLREKARPRFTHPDRMYFTREALEQASGEAVSRYRATRFAAFSTVLDLCCGIGADTIALAAAGCRVEAVDSDPLRLAMAEVNAAVCAVADRIGFHRGDVLTMPLAAAAAAFVDPSRRAGDRRLLDPERYLPPLGAVLGRFSVGFPIGVKIAPGVAWSDLGRYAAEVEFVSVGGELKECVLWFGPLRTAGRRATVLPSPLEGEGLGVRGTVPPFPSPPTPLPQVGRGARGHTLCAEGEVPDEYPSEPAGYVFDPDPAVIRAGLTGLLAEQLGAVPVDHGVAFLTGPNPARSPFATCHAVEHAAPFHLGKLRDYLRERRIGRVTILKRAVDLDVNDVSRKLKLDGPDHRTVILVRSRGRPWAVVCSV